MHTTVQSRTVERPRRYRERRVAAARPPYDWDTQRPVAKGETFPLFAAGLVLGFFATLVCYAKGYVLLYGDAVAHLGIARRILDAHYPGLSQLGGVWLPLPHLLMLPFVQKISWWQSGLAGAPMSIVSYAASVAAIWRLGRRVMSPRWALVATAFYALNANLLFLASTAMTEALFLGLLLWTVEAAACLVNSLRAGEVRRARGWMLGTGVLIFLQVFTRYDGWIFGTVVWCVVAWSVWRSGDETRRRVLPMFAVFTVIVVSGPLLWFLYNAHFEGDWLDWMRGPYSAKQIERKTAPPGQHYRGWLNPGWALLFYTRTAQVDAAVWETGFALMAAAVAGLWLSVRRWAGSARLLWLLWVPLPFYVYSVAYGSVPIFIPQLWPHSYYNARYGMELLPALAVFPAYAGWVWLERLRGDARGWARVVVRFAGPVAMLLCVANSIGMMYRIPAVLKEGIVNAMTRVAFEAQLAESIEQFPAGVPFMMYTSAHIGAVQVAGRPLRSVVSEMDDVAWQKALKDPAKAAAYVIAMQGGPVAKAVQAHPEGLQELEVVCTTGQPCARIYKSTVWQGGATPP